jgi:hypothetical protein
MQIDLHSGSSATASFLAPLCKWPPHVQSAKIFFIESHTSGCVRSAIAAWALATGAAVYRLRSTATLFT